MVTQVGVPDDRDYLINLYNQLWNNLIGAETRLLQFLGFYGVVLGLLIGSAPDHIPVDAPVIAIVFASVWAAHVAIDANHWARRNHALVALVERRLAAQDTLNFLFPASYRQPRYGISSIYQIHLSFFLVVCLLTISQLFHNAEEHMSALTVSGLLLLLGIVTVIWRYIYYEGQFSFYNQVRP